MLTSALRAHLAAYGIVSAQGAGGVGSVIKALHEEQETLPMQVRLALHGLVAQLRGIETGIERIEAEVLKWHRAREASRRLATIPGIGPITACAIAASVPDTLLFRSGRQFAAWLGLTRKAHSSGGSNVRSGSASRATDTCTASWWSARPQFSGSLGKPTLARRGPLG
jgi:transposase